MQIIILALLISAANAVDCSTTAGSASCATNMAAIATPAGANCAADPCTDADHRVCCTPTDGFWINAAGAAVADTDLSACTGKTDPSGEMARLVAATDIADATCRQCAVGGDAATFGPVDGSDTCKAVTACAGTDGASTPVTRVQVAAATEIADRTCTPCAAGFWAAGNANCAAHSTPTCGKQAAVGDADAVTRLKAGTATTDATCDACATGTSAAADANNCAAAASTQTYGTCTAAEATTMMECGDKGRTENGDPAKDPEKACGIYQIMNACYPACLCEDATWAAAVAEMNKQAIDAITEFSSAKGAECTLKCGVGPAPAVDPAPAPATLQSAANPSTIGFTSVALIVAALFATL